MFGKDEDCGYLLYGEIKRIWRTPDWPLWGEGEANFRGSEWWWMGEAEERGGWRWRGPPLMALLPRIQAQWIPIEHSSGHSPCCRGHTGSWRYRWDPVFTQVSEAWDVQPLRSPACLPPVLSWEGCRAWNRDDCDRGRSQRRRGRRNGAAALKTGRLTLNFKTLLFFLQRKQRGIY